MLIFLHYYRKMKYFLFYNCLKVSSNPACFGEGFTRSVLRLEQRIVKGETYVGY